jgi:DNA-binding beta-propeller fold protein YncE
MKRIKPSYVLFVLGLMLVLFMADCQCSRDYIDPQHFWVICSDHLPALTNGRDVRYSGPYFDASQYNCPDTSNSPIWIGSGKPIYGTTPVHSSAVKPRAVTSGLASFLPVPLLDLPFPAQRSGTENTSLSCDPSQPDVLTVNHDNSSVNRTSTCPFAHVATIHTVSRPLQIAITPDGKTALVTSYDNAINFIDLTSNTVTATMSTPGIYPNGIAITSDGKTAYVASFFPSASVVKIDIASRAIVATLSTPSFAQNAVLSPDDSQLFVTFPYNNLVWMIDTLTFNEAMQFSISAPRGIAFNSKGTKAYIASTDNPDNSLSPGKVFELNTNTFQIDNTYQVGVGPNDVAVLYFDQFVVVNNYEGQSISKIDTVTGAVKTTPVTGKPSGISIVY